MVKGSGHYGSGVECGRENDEDDPGLSESDEKNLVNLLVAKCAYQARDLYLSIYRLHSDLTKSAWPSLYQPGAKSDPKNRRLQPTTFSDHLPKYLTGQYGSLGEWHMVSD